MSAVTSYSRTAANNNSAAPNGWPEGQAASTVNDCAREMMKGIVDEATYNECKRVGSVAGTANAITGSITPAITVYKAEMMVVITPASTNTGATTLALNGLTALDVFNIDGTACVGGELVAGIPAVLVLDSGADDWIIVNPNVLKSRGREVGARGITINTQTGNYTVLATDYEKVIFYSGTGGHTITFPSNTLQVGDVVKVIHAGSGSLTLAASGTLAWLNGSGSVPTGSRSLAIGGSATLLHASSVIWDVEGTGLS